MRNNKDRKIMSIFAVLALLISTLVTGFLFVPMTFAGDTVGNQIPSNINLTEPANGSYYGWSQTITISWVNATDSSTNFRDVDMFLINVTGPAFPDGETVDTVLNSSATNDSYDWVISNNLSLPSHWGNYTITVTGVNTTGGYTESSWSNYTYILGTPGYNMWQGGNKSVTDEYDDNTILDTETADLEYNPDTYVDIEVNDNLNWDGSKTYYLYKPEYNGTSDFATSKYAIRWARVESNSEGAFAKVDPTSDYSFEGVLLDRAGLWIINASTENYIYPDLSTFEKRNSTIAGWFWVNTSSTYDLDVSDTTFPYNSTGEIDLTVTDDDGAVAALVDVRRNDNGSSIAVSNKYTAGDGIYSYTKNKTRFWSVGNYTAYAYMDVDTWDGYVSYYGQKNMDNNEMKSYNKTYGADAALTGKDAWLNAVTQYNWTVLGPWDPPELNASNVDITVETAEPYTSVTNDTMYWGFDGEVNITLKETSDVLGSFDSSNTVVYVYDDDGVNVTSHLMYSSSGSGQIDISNVDKGYIHINMTEWGKNISTGSFADNGTWYAYIYVDMNDDRKNDNKEWTEEWNATVEWSVKKAPKAQFKWINDDGGIGDDQTDGIIPYIPTVANVPLEVEFQILGQDGSKYGDGFTPSEKGENITISGNSLFTGTLDEIPGVDCAAGTWMIPVIPTMSVGGGEITITADAFNSTAEGVLSIGGADYEKNGSIVEVTPNEFMIDQEDQTLTVTVKNADTGTANPYCTVSLYYLDEDGEIKGDSVTSTSDSPYTLEFNITQQTNNQTEQALFAAVKAPRNLTIYVAGPGGANQRNGYALIRMNPVNDLEVELSHDTIIAGKQYDDFTIDCTFAGNSTDTPSEDDEDDFYIKIYNETGEDWTDDLLNGVAATDLNGAYSFDFNNVYATEPGTYTFYAYNNTHNSKGYNATLVVEQVTVECDKTPLIWGYDDNISATFTVTYNGEPINGSLILDNITKVSHDDGDYNATWYNTSFNETTENFDGTTVEGIEIDSDDLVNGVITINDITADNLLADEASQNITFWFKPDSDDGPGAYAKVIGVLPVSVPTVTPDPQYIAVGETTTVDITVTGRDILLDDIFVALNGRGVEQNGTSGADGVVTFSLLPTSSGNISIDVGEEGRTVDTVIIATNWKLDISVSPDTVDEGDDFTVTITEENSGEAVEGATVTINGIGSADTDENGEATFTAPSVTSDRSFTIKASKEGYAPETDTVTIFVTNVPALVISADAKVQAGATFDVAVAKDTGDPVVGATVTLDGEEYKTKAGGVATLTAPDKEGTYTITATFSDFVSAETTIKVTPGTPGFELLTLIAAIGVAFILLRRRRNK